MKMVGNRCIFLLEYVFRPTWLVGWNLLRYTNVVSFDWMGSSERIMGFKETWISVSFGVPRYQSTPQNTNGWNLKKNVFGKEDLPIFWVPVVRFGRDVGCTKQRLSWSDSDKSIIPIKQSTSEQWRKTWLFRVCRGFNLPIYLGDYYKPWNKDPLN